MDEDQRQGLAEKRADAYAPAPAGRSLMAGLCVATVLAVGDFAVSGFYGWRVQDHILIACLIAASGFVAGVIGHKNLAGKNRRATRVERRRIDKDHTGPGG